MESSQSLIDAYSQGYKDGWQSVPGSGAAAASYQLRQSAIPHRGEICL
jgi:hypothetical protein